MMEPSAFIKEPSALMKTLPAWMICCVFLACSEEATDPDASGRTDPGALIVHATSYPLAYFAERIGGSAVDVAFPVPQGVDPAHWMPDRETIATGKDVYRFFATGDYDGNGFSDLILQERRTGNLLMHLFDSDSVSRARVRENGLIPSSWDPEDYRVASSADFDGDGFCDIALRHTSGELLLLYMEGSEALRGLSVDIPQAWSVDGVGLENPASE